MMNESAVLYGVEDLRIEDRPIPPVGPGEVRVRVEATGICGSDVHYFEHGRIGAYSVDAPMVLGHESAGTIVEVGEGVPRERIGELVAIEPGHPDGTCAECRAGRYNLCPDVRFFATPPIDGSLTGFVCVPAAFAHQAPRGMSAEAAAMAEPVSVGIAAARRAQITAGDRVLVTGAGPVGIFAAQVARAFGATEVTLSDVNESRLGVARRLGFATVTAGEGLEGPFNVLLECSGNGSALQKGMEQLAPAARVVLIGMGADRLEIDVPLVQARELTIVGLFRYANTYPLALELLTRGTVDVTPVITHRFPVAEVESALRLARRDPNSLKAVVVAPV